MAAERRDDAVHREGLFLRDAQISHTLDAGFNAGQHEGGGESVEVSFNGGLTRVMNAFFRGTRPREYVDSAPHTVADASPTLSDCRGFAGSPRHRHASSYRLDPLDAGVRAAASAWLTSTSASACAASRA